MTAVVKSQKTLMGRAHGKGKAVLQAFGRETSFSELSYTYPLKILSPRMPIHGTHPVALAYILSYGGGLVAGDSIELEVEVGEGAALMLLTQGSTKVFKSRMENDHRLASATPAPGADTLQHMNVSVGPGAVLLHLVDPVTCFRRASYVQEQTFRLAPDASVVVLDWITSGRMSRGEQWEFAKYHSVNEVWQAGRRLARDATLLQAPQAPPPLVSCTLRDRLAPYVCYATVLLFGPAVTTVVARMSTEYGALSQMQRGSTPCFVWSLSMLEGGCVIRAAGEETEQVKDWLRAALQDLEVVVGRDVYSRAFV